MEVWGLVTLVYMLNVYVCFFLIDLLHFKTEADDT